MVELFKLAIEKPFQAITVLLCMVTTFTVLGLFEAREALAVIQLENKQQEVINTKVLAMGESLARIDENVKFLKSRHLLQLSDTGNFLAIQVEDNKIESNK